jgi:hypothetical protein
LAQCLAQTRRRRSDVEEQAKLAKIGRLGQVKAEILVPQGVGGEIEKLDLMLNTNSSIRILDLIPGQSRQLEQWIGIDSCTDYTVIGKPRDRTCGGLKLAELPSVGIAHDDCLSRKRTEFKGCRHPDSRA